MKEVLRKLQMLLVCFNACGRELQSGWSIESPAVVEAFGDIALDLLFKCHTKPHRLVTQYLMHKIRHMQKSGSSWNQIYICSCFDVLLTWILLGPMFFTGGGWHGSTMTNTCPFKEAELTRLVTITSTINSPVLCDKLFYSITQYYIAYSFIALHNIVNYNQRYIKSFSPSSFSRKVMKA